MLVIKIDSENRTITEIEISRKLESLQEIVEGYICLAFDYPNEKHCCFVNDEWLFNNPKFFFESDFGHQPFAGNGVIVGLNSKGDSVDCKLTVEEVKKSIKFYSIEEIQERIRNKDINYNAYMTTSDGTKLIREINLGAFDKKIKEDD